MEHRMRLVKEYFDAIKKGTKRYELRLNDEKRQLINVGDLIIFEEVDNPNNILKTKVKSLNIFNTFEELINTYDIEFLGKKEDTKEKLLSLLEGFYPKEEQAKYKCLAIEIEKYEKACGIVVFNDEDKMLMVKSTKGHWGIPKGHVEDNETEEETAIREVLEETNVKATIIDGFRSVDTYSPKVNTTKDVVFFVGKANNTDIIKQESEVAVADFYNLDESLKLVEEYPNTQEVLTKAYKFYKGE